ncbi:MAG: 50S ribosomal protein L4 [Nitrospiraceae bacterium]|jgi:large subunit ribosomal protein L4|nr:50S ribosomal protein L4 [Nitrospiraceae bacterium]
MVQIDIKDTNNAIKGSMRLSELVFANEASEALVHEAVVAYLANQRQGTHMTKTRGLVSGGGRKPYKQKSTGRARAGSSRSPLWRKGGTIFGPQPRDYSISMPKQARRTALCKALTMKLNDGQIVVLESLSVSKPNTKEIVKVVANLGLSDQNIYLVIADTDQNILLSSRNLPNVDVIRVADLNAYHVAACDSLVFTADAMKLLAGEEEAA